MYVFAIRTSVTMHYLNYIGITGKNVKRRPEEESVFECVNRTLKLKETITKFSENNMKVDGRINGKDNKETSDGEADVDGHNMVHTTNAHSLSFPSICVFFQRFVTLSRVQS